MLFTQINKKLSNHPKKKSKIIKSLQSRVALKDVKLECFVCSIYPFRIDLKFIVRYIYFEKHQTILRKKW